MGSSKTNRGKEEMDCVSGKMEPARARSEERGDGTSGSSVGRRPSLPAHNQARGAAAWPAHYSTGRDRKTSGESLERLTSRTLSPAPETLPRKFSRTHGTSVLPTHPELPPLNSSSPSGPRLEEYLEKPRLVSTVGRKSSSAGDDATDPLSQQLARLSSYYNQTFLSSCSTCDSMSHKNPVGVLTNNRG